MKLLKWDYTDEVNLAVQHDDYWNKSKTFDDDWQRAHNFLDTLEEDKRAFYEVEAVLPYEWIVEIDPIGDTIARCPHIFVDVRNDSFFHHGEVYLAPRGERWMHKHELKEEDQKTRVSIFPKKLPKPKKPKPLPPMGSKKKVEKKKSVE